MTQDKENHNNYLILDFGSKSML